MLGEHAVGRGEDDGEHEQRRYQPPEYLPEYSRTISYNTKELIYLFPSFIFY